MAGPCGPGFELMSCFRNETERDASFGEAATVARKWLVGQALMLTTPISFIKTLSFPSRDEFLESVKGRK